MEFDLGVTDHFHISVKLRFLMDDKKGWGLTVGTSWSSHKDLGVTLSMAQVGQLQGDIPWPRAGPICFQVALAGVEIVSLVIVPWRKPWKRCCFKFHE